MPEEKKKDSFTFSDKIKNSKPVPSKSFANRISSKIGSDGKPKKTLFERTRRDAPFFIAALVALLLLPFLYKYSGQVSEEPVVLPGSEESIFDPERYGFDTATGDPDGQIEQLAGRDPLSLIKGFGSQDENTADARYDQPVDRSGLSDDDSYNSSTVEENNTNIYKRQAAPATRAAFRRAATKINKLDGAGMTGRSGGKLGVGMWGGNLKSAAKKVGSSAPRTSPKPVSLQPLQAAGKPSRSYFGQGAAAEARRSKDAMSKANAMQALRDAAMKPVEPGKIGGLGGGAFGPGGGNGKLDRNFVWNGKEPWWWDLMKTRSQKEWEAKFNRKWDWIKWGDKLAQNILGGILNCLLTGKDDGGMGNLFGTVEGAGDADKCGKMTQKDWDACPECQKYGSKMTKAACQTLFGYTPGDKNKVDPWKGGDKANADLNFFQVRWDCLTEGFGKRSKKLSEQGDVKGDCSGLATDGIYRASYSSQKGEDRKYFSYVVGIPTDKLDPYYNKMQPTEQRKQWVVGAVVPGTTLNLNLLKDRKNFVPLFVESVAVKPKKVNNDGSKVETKKDAASVLTEASTEKGKNVKLTYDALIATLADGGVFYDTRYDIAADSDAATKGTAKFSLKGGKKGKDWIVGGRCQVPFARVTCENFALTGPKETQIYPFAHIQFANGVTVGEGKYYSIIARKFKIVYKVLQGDNYGKTLENDHATGVYTIQHNTIEPYNESWFKGSEVQGDGARRGWITRSRTAANKGDTYQVIAAGEKALVKEDKENKNRDASRVIKWEIYQCDNADIAGDALADGGCDNGLWPQFDKDGKMIGEAGQRLPGVVLSTAVCEYGRSGDAEDGTSTSVEEPKCKSRDESPECCQELGQGQYEWKDGKCELKESEEGGDRLPGSPNPNLNPPAPGKDLVRLAPVIEWVPRKFDDRQSVVQGSDLGGGSFGSGKLIPGATDEQHCGAASSNRVVQTESAKQFVNQVVAAYNAKKAGAQQMAEVVAYPTLGEVVDSLNIAFQVGVTMAPKEVVCQVARTMAGISRDPQAKNATWKTTSGETRYFHNELGAYLAYVHPEAAFYPAKYYEESGNCDKRFLALSESGCRTLLPEVKDKKQYHHSNYAWNGNTRAYLQSLKPEMKKYPLKALAEGISFNPGACKEGCGPQRRQYTKSMASLLQGQCPTGDMNVADALAYVTAACTNGLNYKPYGAAGSRRGNSRDRSGSSGNNRQVKSVN